MPLERVVKALYQYGAQDEDELSFAEDELLAVTKTENDEWLMATRLDGEENSFGLVPSNYVEDLECLEVMQAAFSYEANEENELSMQKSQPIYLMNRLQSDWWLARNECGQFGLVPASYLQAPVSKLDHLADALQSVNDEAYVDPLEEYEKSLTKPQPSVHFNCRWEGVYVDEAGKRQSGLFGVTDDDHVAFLAGSAALFMLPLRSVILYDGRSLKCSGGKTFKLSLPQGCLLQLSYAQYGYEAQDADEVSIKEGQKLLLVKHVEDNDGWSMVFNSSRCGIVPTSYIADKPPVPLQEMEQLSSKSWTEIDSSDCKRSPEVISESEVSKMSPKPFEASKPVSLESAPKLATGIPPPPPMPSVAASSHITAPIPPPPPMAVVAQLPSQAPAASASSPPVMPSVSSSSLPRPTAVPPPPPMPAVALESPTAVSSRQIIPPPSVAPALLQQTVTRQSPRPEASSPRTFSPKANFIAPPAPTSPKPSIVVPSVPPQHNGAFKLPKASSSPITGFKSPADGLQPPKPSPAIQSMSPTLDKPMSPIMQASSGSTSPSMITKSGAEMFKSGSSKKSLSELAKSLSQPSVSATSSAAPVIAAPKPASSIEAPPKVAAKKDNPWGSLQIKKPAVPSKLAIKTNFATADVSTKKALPERPKEGGDAKPKPGNTRLWNDKSGKFQVEAEFSGFESGQVRLWKLNGKTIIVPIEMLSERDVEFVYRKEGIPFEGVSTCSAIEGGWLPFLISLGIDTSRAGKYADTLTKEQLVPSQFTDLTRDFLKARSFIEADIMCFLKAAAKRKAVELEKVAAQANLQKVKSISSPKEGISTAVVVGSSMPSTSAASEKASPSMKALVVPKNDDDVVHFERSFPAVDALHAPDVRVDRKPLATFTATQTLEKTTTTTRPIGSPSTAVKQRPQASPAVPAPPSNGNHSMAANQQLALARPPSQMPSQQPQPVQATAPYQPQQPSLQAVAPYQPQQPTTVAYQVLPQPSMQPMQIMQPMQPAQPMMQPMQHFYPQPQMMAPPPPPQPQVHHNIYVTRYTTSSGNSSSGSRQPIQPMISPAAQQQQMAGSHMMYGQQPPMMGNPQIMSNPFMMMNPSMNMNPFQQAPPPLQNPFYSNSNAGGHYPSANGGYYYPPR